MDYQLRQVWERQTFIGIGQAPIEVANEDEMLARVLACTLTRCILLSYATFRSQGSGHLDALRQVTGIHVE